jgi:hypothetical protein
VLLRDKQLGFFSQHGNQLQQYTLWQQMHEHTARLHRGNSQAHLQWL